MRELANRNYMIIYKETYNILDRLFFSSDYVLARDFIFLNISETVIGGYFQNIIYKQINIILFVIFEFACL